MNTVADLVIDALRKLGIDTLFCVPGVQNDDFFDRMVDARDIRPVVARHEQGAAYMAMGYAQATGRPAACSVVPGPGMLNAAAGLTSAYWGNARVLALVGQLHTWAIGRAWGVLHDLPDQTAILRQLTKHSELVTDPAAAAGQIQAAIDALVSDRPRPVSIEVPVDVWAQPAEPTLVAPTAEMPALDTDAVGRAVGVLAAAERPLVVVGGGAQDAASAVSELIDAFQAPVTTRRMGHGVVPTAHPLFVPLPVGRDLWRDADVVLAVGTRLEFPLLHWGADEDLTIVKIDIDADELDRHGLTGIGIHGDAADACRALADGIGRRAERPGLLADLDARRRAFQDEISYLQPQLDYLAAIRDVLPDDGVIVEDVTQIGFAAHLAFPFTRPRTFLSSGPAGTLGAAFPTGLGARVGLGDRTMLTVSGDGGFLFAATELATAVQHDIAAVTLVFNDGAFGNVKRLQQNRFGPDRTIVSDLHNPDLVAFTESFGALGLRVESPDELRLALERAWAHGGPVVIEATVGPMPDPWPYLRMGRVRGEPHY